MFVCHLGPRNWRNGTFDAAPKWILATVFSEDACIEMYHDCSSWAAHPYPWSMGCRAEVSTRMEVL
jgi:hypothetical protein